MAGVYNGDPSIRDNDDHGVDFSMNGPFFGVMEIAYQRNNLPSDRGLIGNYKAGFGTTTVGSLISTPAGSTVGTGASIACSTKFSLGSENRLATGASA